MPPVVAVPPLGTAVPLDDLPAPVTVPAAPWGLLGAHCEASPFPPSSSAAAPGPVSAPQVPAVLGAAAPPGSPDMPPVVAVPPPGTAVPLDDLPAPVTVPAAPVGLPGAHCEASPSPPSSSAAAPGPVSAPQVSAVLGAGVAAESPAVCYLVPPVVKFKSDNIINCINITTLSTISI
ncbi:uncharacterized protein [Procambarus clarkii]|uniref:uncharacterized protein n=1 Tax=Procambarus clarkii TaxID=6728 RepID=UPI003743F561